MAQVFDLANVLQSAEGIKGSRTVNALNQQKLEQGAASQQNQQLIKQLTVEAIQNPNPQTLNALLAASPEAAQQLFTAQQGGQAVEQGQFKLDQTQADSVMSIGKAALKAPDSAAFLKLAAPAYLAGLKEQGINIDDLSDAETDNLIRGTMERSAPFATPAAAKPAGQQEFESLIESLPPEDKALATRIKAGLEPRAVGGAPKVFDAGGVPFIIDPNQPVGQRVIPVDVSGTKITAQTVADSEATIAEAKSKATGKGARQSKAIDTAFDKITKINGNLRTFDRAITMLEDGANTGAIQRFLPSFQKASVGLEQIQNELALDVVGATTFGALSESELQFAKDTALPKGLDEAALLDWIQRKKSAQGKLRDYFEEQIAFLDAGGSVAEFVSQGRERRINSLPEGTIDNGDGTFTLPTGETVRPKE